VCACVCARVYLSVCVCVCVCVCLQPSVHDSVTEGLLRTRPRTRPGTLSCTYIYELAHELAHEHFHVHTSTHSLDDAGIEGLNWPSVLAFELHERGQVLCLDRQGVLEHRPLDAFGARRRCEGARVGEVVLKYAQVSKETSYTGKRDLLSLSYLGVGHELAR
jgi:hypothetical protein